MIQFIVQTASLLILWGLFFVRETSSPTSISVIICAAVITLYFFLKIAPKPFYLYGAMTGLLLYLGVLEEGKHYLLLLILFIALMASEQLSHPHFKSLVLPTLICLLVFLVLKLISLTVFLYALLFYFLTIQVNALWTKRQEQRELYQELLGEFRKLKRIARATEEEARYQERTKIARDIHDSVGHKLTALLMQLEILSIQHGADHYQELKELAKDSLEETRYAVRALKDQEHEGIATIMQLIKKLEAESHILVQFTTKQGILSEHITNEQSVVLYRVIQEGLTNAMRHAHSREVQVEIGKTANGHVECIIKNRIYQKDPFFEGFGLQNMRKRVEELGGTLSIYQTENHFIIKGIIPLVT